MKTGHWTKKFVLLACIAFIFSACAAKQSKFELKDTLSSRLAKSTAWRNYDPKQREDVAFSAIINKLERGYGYLTGKNYVNAFYTFDAILSDPQFVKYEEYKYAKFYLAETLELMGVNYGALLYFVDILKKEDGMPYLEESLKRAIAISQDFKDDSLILYLATVLTGDRIPERMREEFRFFIAKNFYIGNTFKNAGILFKAITPKNRLYLLAQYYLGVMSVQREKFKRSLKHFSTIASTERPEKYYEWEHLTDLANMNIGRILFEAGLLKKSVEYYGEIPKESDIYPLSLYESSWALYNWGKFNAALSTLHSLQSPFYEITYFPRSILLKGAFSLSCVCIKMPL